MNRLRRAWRAFWWTPTSPTPDGVYICIVDHGVSAQIKTATFEGELSTHLPSFYEAELMGFEPPKQTGTFSGTFA